MTITILTFLLIRCRSDRPRGDSIELLSLLSVRQIRPNWAQVGAHSTTVPFYYFFQRSFSNFSPASAQNTSERSHFTKLFSKKILFLLLTELFFQTVLSSIRLLRRLGEIQRRNLLISRYTFLGLKSFLKSPLLQKKTILFVQKSYCP
jgi:hypothetical protein